MTTADVGSPRRGLALTAMIFAVAMTFIDMTIVSIAAPQIQSELKLSATGLQWAVNAYLLALAALFAFGGRLADTLGHRRMVLIGIATFAVASAMCGFTPSGSLAEVWIVTFRALQGAGGALMYPAALAIVVNSYEVRERGKAMALFFGIAGGLTAVGPALGGFLTQWTWRAIFWVNIPIAIVALVLTVLARPASIRTGARMDYRGFALVAAGTGLSVFGFQQAASWGWSDPLTGGCIGLGFVLLLVFGWVELRTRSPLIELRIFADRGFLVDNVILGLSMVAFVPIFFFASEYAQVSLGEKPAESGLLLLYFFIGFATSAQLGGRMLDRGGAWRPVVLGCAVTCAGLVLWGQRLDSLHLGGQIWCIILTGAGLGLIIGQANTDALNRAPATAYGEVTGITQTVRNYGSSLGIAVLGTIQVTQLRSHLTSSLIAQGAPPAEAHRIAAQSSQSDHATGSTVQIPHFVQLDFAQATRTVFYVMAGVMALACVIAALALPRASTATGSEPALNEPAHPA
jgi:EmrB/QacA subfamily drug resistance transporter